MRKAISCFGLCVFLLIVFTIPAFAANQVNTMDIQAVLYKDGVNFRFVNDRMNTTPTDITLQIQLADETPITDEMADIGGFGFAGKVMFENGCIAARTDTPLSTENHVTVLFALGKGILSPTRQEAGSFEEVKNKALEGSNYDSGGSSGEEVSTIKALTVTLLSFGIPIGIIIWMRNMKKKQERKKQKRLSERFGYFRELPNEGNLSATYALGRLFDVCEDGAVLATGMLRLIQLGCLSPVETPEVSLMSKNKETVSLRLMGSQHRKMNEYDEYLYTVLESAAGSDTILQAKEMERFASQNDKALRAYIQRYDSAGRAWLSQNRCLKRWSIPPKIADLTPTGEQELGEVMGFKWYLEDFSLISEQGVKEISIWRELLSYAMFFGIADQVAEQIKVLYPAFSSELTEYRQGMSAAYSYHYLLCNSMKEAEQRREEENRSSGGGSVTSFSGGNGFIGGGSGGRTR